MATGDYEVHDPRFLNLFHGNASIDVLWKGARWCEGPVYVPAGRYLLWSDIPNDRVMRWDACSGAVSVFESPCDNRNGHALDRQGRVVFCEHRTRSIARIGFDGRREILADRFAGMRLNSPNDLTVKSDDSIWFSDPTYGIDSDYEGDASDSEIGAQNVYRIATGGEVTLVAGDLLQPNGLAFSPDEALLYISDTGFTHDKSHKPRIRVYPLSDNGKSLGLGRDFVEGDYGLFDGFRVDAAGNVWTSAGKGVNCYAADGTLLGRIPTDEVVANLAFGGSKRNRLFICATTTLCAVYLNASGVS